MEFRLHLTLDLACNVSALDGNEVFNIAMMLRIPKIQYEYKDNQLLLAMYSKIVCLKRNTLAYDVHISCRERYLAGLKQDYQRMMVALGIVTIQNW